MLPASPSILFLLQQNWRKDITCFSQTMATSTMSIPILLRNGYGQIIATPRFLNSVFASAACTTHYPHHLTAVRFHHACHTANVSESTTSLPASVTIWHRRLGHLNIPDLRSLTTHSTGLHLDNSSPQFCVGCALGKLTRKKVPKEALTSNITTSWAYPHWRRRR